MSNFHKQAIGFAIAHFIVCAVLTTFGFICALGGTIQSPHHSDPWWFNAIQGLIVTLEAPVAAFVWLARRDAPSGDISFLVIAVLAGLWSLAFGYIVGFVRHRIVSARDENESAN